MQDRRGERRGEIRKIETRRVVLGMSDGVYGGWEES
jgi:hypothetical protein